MDPPILPHQCPPIKLERHSLGLFDIDRLQSLPWLESRFIDFQLGVQVVVGCHWWWDSLSCGGTGMRICRGGRIWPIGLGVIDNQNFASV